MLKSAGVPMVGYSGLTIPLLLLTSGHKAYCAYLQMHAEDNDPNWIGPITTEAIKEGGKGGIVTIEAHIKAAASIGS